MDREQAFEGPSTYRGMQHRHRLGGPRQLDVALVRDDDGAALASPVDDLAQVIDGQHTTGRVGRRVQPHQTNPLWTQRSQ